MAYTYIHIFDKLNRRAIYRDKLSNIISNSNFAVIKIGAKNISYKMRNFSSKNAITLLNDKIEKYLQIKIILV